MEQRKKLIIIIVIFAAIFVVLVVVAIVLKSNASNTASNSPPNDVNQNSYVDPSTGETVLNPTNQVGDSSPTDKSAAVILGPSQLINIGLSSNQVQLLSTYLSDYAANNKLGADKITAVSIVISSLTQNTNPDSGQSEITADLMVNKNTTQYMDLLYLSTDDLQITISDSNHKPIYNGPSNAGPSND
jgi:hypothetical protein